MAAIKALRQTRTFSQSAAAAAVGASSTAAALLAHANTVPANTLQVGDVIRGRVVMLVTTAGAYTFTVALANGTTALITPASAVTTGTLTARAVTVEYEITVREVGSTGTLELVAQVSPLDTAALVPARASATVDLTADLALDTQVTFGTSGANSATGEQHNTRVDGQ